MMDKLLVQGLYKQRDLLALRMGILVVYLMTHLLFLVLKAQVRVSSHPE
jgi:hypothetical protein